MPDDEVDAIFTDKADVPARVPGRLAAVARRAARPAGHAPTPDLLRTLQAWWEPLLAMAPTLRAGVGANCLLRAGDLDDR